MMERIPQFSQAQNVQDTVEPNEPEIKEYFRRLGLQFRKEFRILKSEEFRVSGNEAKKEGWFIGYRGIVEAAMSLKLSELLGLSEEEKRLLAEASLVNAAMRRVQYEKKGSSLSSKERDAIDATGDQSLIAQGVDERALVIGRAGSGARSLIEIVQSEEKPRTAEEEQVRILSKYFAYVHNCVDIQISQSPEGAKSQKSDIIDWRRHLDEAEVRYTEIAAEQETVRGVRMGNFEAQKMLLGEIEVQLRERIHLVHPELSPKEGEPLWKCIRDRMQIDIKEGVVPRVPAR